MLASTPAGPSVLALSGTGSTDSDTNPAQPHTYAWEQVDAAGVPVPSGDPSRGTFSTPNAISTTWTAPSTAPYTVYMRLTVDDGMSLPGVATTPPISITTSRPGANAGNDRLVNPGQVASLDGSGSTDDGEPAAHLLVGADLGPARDDQLGAQCDGEHHGSAPELR